MSILSDILGLGTAAATGGLFGLLGSITGQVSKYLEKKQDYAFKLKEWDHETALAELQLRAHAAETEQEISLSAVRGSWDGLNSSVQAAASDPPSYKWVNAVKSLTRPALTAALVLFLCVAMVIMGPGPDRAELVTSLIFAATTAIAWWFGDRAPAIQGPLGKPRGGPKG